MGCGCGSWVLLGLESWCYGCRFAPFAAVRGLKKSKTSKLRDSELIYFRVLDFDHRMVCSFVTIPQIISVDKQLYRQREV